MSIMQALLGDLGDVVCTAAEAQAGVNAIGQLIDYWHASGSPPQFKSAVEAIVTRGQAAAGQLSASTSAVGNCALKDAGLQAQDLIAQIGRATGNAAPSPQAHAGPSEGLSKFGELFGTLAWVLGGYAVFKIFSRRQGT